MEVPRLNTAALAESAVACRICMDHRPDLCQTDIPWTWCDQEGMSPAHKARSKRQPAELCCTSAQSTPQDVSISVLSSTSEECKQGLKIMFNMKKHPVFSPSFLVSLKYLFPEILGYS